ncbi:MAG TPA: enoyl-CoA hydratase-related protein [Anaeromyxobacteraceae bacterium]|nr:enoyl-CoA hydratase-related protein [Anaeromyxobacteraceae bacterium]
MNQGQILSRTDGPVRILTIDRPEKRNALTIAMYESLIEELRKVDAEDGIRVVLLTGQGDAFTAGNDLGDFLHDPPAGEDSAVVKLLFQLVDLQKPLVAAVDGPAIGIGTTLLLHADYVLASTRARFQFPFVQLGITPEGGSTLLLPLLVGMARASEWLLFGDSFDAAAAKEARFVNAVVPSEELATAALARSRSLANRPFSAVLATKHLLRAPLRERVKDALRREGQQFIERVRSPEAVAAFRAFLERGAHKP